MNRDRYNHTYAFIVMQFFSLVIMVALAASAIIDVPKVRLLHTNRAKMFICFYFIRIEKIEVALTGLPSVLVYAGKSPE